VGELYTIIIATRNNQCALAGLLSSILAVYEGHVSIIIADSSDQPIVTNNHIARLIARLGHVLVLTCAPDANKQRMEALSASRDEKILLLDDDMLLRNGYETAAAEACAAITENIPIIFGTSVDASNERGYPDYHPTYEGAVGTSSHRFCDQRAIISCPDLATFAANPGHCMAFRWDLWNALQACRDDKTPGAVTDDAAAVLLARLALKAGCCAYHSGMRAWHMGNNNRWWNQGAIKHFAVSQRVEQAISSEAQRREHA
jgi:hypothetical protein